LQPNDDTDDSNSDEDNEKDDNENGVDDTPSTYVYSNIDNYCSQ